MKLLTFNVFIGSPIVKICNGTSFLHGERLKQQIVEIKKIDADIICLQEIYCEKIISYYLKEFDKDYQIIYQNNPIYSNILLGEIIIILVVYILLYMLNTLIKISLYIFIRRYLTSCAIFSFLAGKIKGFMITLVKRNSNIEVLHHETIEYNHQHDDFQNMFRKRCYQKIVLNINNTLLNLYNIHLNAIGSEDIKYLQFNQIVDESKNYIICGDFNSDLNKFKFNDSNLIDSSKLNNNENDHTWTDINPLSKGFIREENARIDGILYKFDNFKQCNYKTEMNIEPFTSDHFGVSMIFNSKIILT